MSNTHDELDKLVENVPQNTSSKKINSAVEELADYLSLSMSHDLYKAVRVFGRLRFLQGERNDK